MVMVMVVVLEEAGGGGEAGYGIKKQNLTQGVRKKRSSKHRSVPKLAPMARTNF